VCEFEIAVADPADDDVRSLVERHLEFGWSHSPPEDAHALDADDLLDPSITLFCFRTSDELLAVGALKQLDERHAELKTMHTAERARRRGIGRAMLMHLLAVARERQFQRVSLETGPTDAFVPARALYASVGFAPCKPFGDYRLSPKSTYMTMTITGEAD
jgi:putative acetyltransferase